MRKAILIFVGMLLFSCGEKVIKEPENLIPKEKMVLVLHDLAVLNATKSSYKAALDNNDIDIMEFLYKKYQIDSVQFSQSDLYYASIPLEYQEIYEKVESILERKKNAMEGKAQKRNDSIRKVRERKNDSVTKARANKKNGPDA
ncbi:DUF4296 domain-containing protein [Flagellimonas sp.]|uniref:DUF4296 domain-containing protein n=1 Tax=Flagellimonas sp. TaxID=2058762 RepID=UPI003B5B86FA